MKFDYQNNQLPSDFMWQKSSDCGQPTDTNFLHFEQIKKTQSLSNENLTETSLTELDFKENSLNYFHGSKDNNLNNLFFQQLALERDDKGELVFGENGQVKMTEVSSFSDEIASEDRLFLVNNQFFTSHHSIAEHIKKGGVAVSSLDGQTRSLRADQLNVGIITANQMKMLTHVIVARIAAQEARKRVEEEKRLAQQKKEQEERQLQQLLTQSLHHTSEKTGPKIKKKENSVLTYCYQNSEKAGRKFEKQVIALRQMMTSLLEQRDKEKQEKKLQAKKELVVNYTEQEKNNNDFSLKPSSNQKIAKFGINDKNHIIKQLQ